MPPLSLEQAYEAFRPLLFRALAGLARHGFVVPADEALDLIHDFFIEAWEGISTRFDPEKGALEAYVYRAFVQFARPRIVRIARFRRSLQNAEELVRMAAEEKPAALDDLDRQRVRSAMATLPADAREALLLYLTTGKGSERRVARTLGVSRYQLRSWLVEALGRIAVHLNVQPGPSSDWEVALALWRDGLTAEQASEALGHTLARIRSSHRRNCARLAANLTAVGRASTVM